MYNHEIILAGFGGQGILSAGSILAYAGMFEKKQVSWLPSYGPEMRGGTANCNVILSEEPIGSPIINKATAIIVLNEPSLDKFEKKLIEGGILIYDSTIVPKKPSRTDVVIYDVPATRVAYELGNKVFTNIILLGKFIDETKAISRESFEKALYKVLPEKKHYLVPEEMKAFEYGANLKLPK